MEKKDFLTSSADQKVTLYAERILYGENPESVMQGLGPVFRGAIEKKLSEIKPSQESEKTHTFEDGEIPHIGNESEILKIKAEQDLRSLHNKEKDRAEIERIRNELGMVKKEEGKVYKTESFEYMNDFQKVKVFNDFVNHGGAVSLTNRENAPFKNFADNTDEVWGFVSDEQIQDYLKNKIFFDTMDIKAQGLERIFEIKKSQENGPVKIPLNQVVCAAGFVDWRGRDPDHTKSFISKYFRLGRNKGSNEMSSLNVIKHYANLSTELPPVSQMNMYIQPDGKVFFDNAGGDSHRIAAAILRGQEFINAENVYVYKIDENYL